MDGWRVPYMVLVLFICSGNTCRSAVAEHVLRKMVSQTPGLNGVVHTLSAGIQVANEGTRPSPDTVEAAQLFCGVDISTHKALQLKETLVNQADIILAMTKQHLEFINKNFPQASSKTMLLGQFATPTHTPRSCGSRGSGGGEGTPEIPDPIIGVKDTYYRCCRNIVQCVVEFVEALQRKNPVHRF